MRFSALAIFAALVAALAVASPVDPTKSIAQRGVNLPKHRAFTVSRRQNDSDNDGNDEDDKGDSNSGNFNSGSSNNDNDEDDNRGPAPRANNSDDEAEDNNSDNNDNNYNSGNQQNSQGSNFSPIVQANQNFANQPPGYYDDYSARTTEGEAISDSTFENLKYYANFAAATYCPNNINRNSIGRNVHCDRNLCPEITDSRQILTAFTQLKAQGWTVQNNEYTHSYFVAKDGNNVVVALRGNGFSDLASASKQFGAFNPVPWDDVPSCQGCNVSSTYLTTWRNIRSDITSAISNNLEQGSRIVIVGHSAGAALATIIAGDLRANPAYEQTLVDLYSFAAPRIGNPNFATFVTNQTFDETDHVSRGNNYRVTHANDHTPQVVPHSVKSNPLNYWSPTYQYRHISPEYWIKAKDTTNWAGDVFYYEPAFNDAGMVLEQQAGSDSNYKEGPSSNDPHGYYIIPMYDSEKSDYTC